MTVPPPDAGASLPLSDEAVPQAGELKIKERRSWKTWQLLSVALVAAIIGMWINGDTGGGSSAASSNPDGSHLPAEGAGAPAAPSEPPRQRRPPGAARPRRRPQPPGAARPPRPRQPAGPRRPPSPGGPPPRPRRRGQPRPGTRAPALAAAKGELDQHRVHDDDRPVEHRLGLQLRPRAGFGSLVPGVRDTVRVVGVSDRNGRHQRDRARPGSRSRRNPAWGRRSSWCRRPRRAPGSSR